jgi:hypothetical protein
MWAMHVGGTLSNGEQVNRLTGLAMKQKPSVDFTGWQRHLELLGEAEAEVVPQFEFPCNNRA